MDLDCDTTFIGWDNVGYLGQNEYDDIPMRVYSFYVIWLMRMTNRWAKGYDYNDDDDDDRELICWA